MDTIGRYRLERRLGAGSFATVWLGRDGELGRPVALKVLAEGWVSDADVRARFLAEAQILRRINDPRLVQVHDIETLDGERPYIVMDYIDGGSLDDLRRTGLPPSRALRLSAEACRALAVLHDHGIVHRDVTPGNLLLRAEPGAGPRVLVADLGVARSTGDDPDTGLAAGTPSYMAPEQAAGLWTVDHRADVYALTAVSYAMLTGRPPFRIRSLAEIIARPAEATPPPLADRLGTPSSLDALLQSGLAGDPARRPPTALLLAEALDAVADELDEGRDLVPPALARPRSPRPAPAPRHPVHHPVPAVPVLQVGGPLALVPAVPRGHQTLTFTLLLVAAALAVLLGYLFSSVPGSI